jgi:hypothetical protein
MRAYHRKVQLATRARVQLELGRYWELMGARLERVSAAALKLCEYRLT